MQGTLVTTCQVTEAGLSGLMWTTPTMARVILRRCLQYATLMAPDVTAYPAGDHWR